MAVEAKIQWDLGKEKLDQLIASIRKTQKELDLTDDEVQDIERSFKKMGREGTKQTKKVAGGMDQMGNMAKKVGGVIVAAFAVDRIVDMQKKIIQLTAEYQKFEAVLTNTLGSKSAAQMAMSQIQQFAAQTPFQVQALTGAFVKLANQGFVPTAQEMRKLGDLAASTGKDFDMLAEAILDAQVGEFERLKEFGIRAAKEGDKVMFTFKGVQKQVDFTEDAIQKYLLSLGDVEGVSGSMAAISQTLGGKISNLGDAFDQLFITLGQAESGILKTITESLADIVGKVTKLIESDLAKTNAVATATFEELKANFGDLKSEEAYRSKISEINDEQIKINEDINETKKLLKEQQEIFNKSNIQLPGLTGMASAGNQAAQALVDLNPKTKEAKRQIEILERELIQLTGEFNGGEEAIRFLEKGLKDLSKLTEDASKKVDQMPLFGKELETLPNTIQQATLEIGKLAPAFDFASQVNTDLVNQMLQEWQDVYNHQQFVRNGMIDLAVESARSIATINQEARDIELAALERQTNQQLALAGDNANRKAEILAESQAREEQIQKQGIAARRRLFLFEQAATLSQIYFNTSAASTAALLPPPIGLGPVAGIPLALRTKIQGAIEAGIVLAQTLPAFKDGTEYVKGPGTGTSDSVPAMLSKGERIVDANRNKKLKGISNEQLVSAVAFWKNMPVQVKGDLFAQGKTKDRNDEVIYELKKLNRKMNGQTAKINLTVEDKQSRLKYLEQQMGVKITDG